MRVEPHRPLLHVGRPGVALGPLLTFEEHAAVPVMVVSLASYRIGSSGSLTWEEGLVTVATMPVPIPYTLIAPSTNCAWATC